MAAAAAAAAAMMSLAAVLPTLIVISLLLSSPSPSPRRRHRVLLLQHSGDPDLCSSVAGVTKPAGLLNYAALRFCILPDDLPFPSVAALFILLLAAQFALLARAAAEHFSPAVAAISSRLRLSPSTAAVTLLALGNGAPDAAASAAALRGGQPRTGLAAILSAGAFVSALVVGSVALIAGPFPVDPGPFVRDVFFYLLAVSGMFYVYLSAEIYLWQAVVLVAFYVFFVGLAFWMDLLSVDRSGGGGGRRRSGIEPDIEMSLVKENMDSNAPDSDSIGASLGDKEQGEYEWASCRVLGKIMHVWETPFVIILKLTIPASSPSQWNRYRVAANICLCPVLLLYSLKSHIELDHRIVFFLPRTLLPLWSVVLFVSLCLATAYFFVETEPPQSESLSSALAAFVMSVFWISTVAGELLNCLAAIGMIMEIPPAILGLTVLAWGNSAGDLFANVAVAKAGQPATAMSGCFAGPMFNMLVGFGTALVAETARVYPGAYKLQFDIGIVVAFVFLLLSLMSSLLVVTWFRFRVPRFWGFFLVGLYLLFTVVSLLIARFPV